MQKNFSDILNSDDELNSLKRRLAETTKEAEKTDIRIGEVNERISSSEINVKSLAAAIVSGEKGAPLVPVSVLKDELTQMKAYLQAVELARKKLGEMIDTRTNVLSRAHAQNCADDQCQRTQRILDALLAIAEANAEEGHYLAAQAASGAKVHHFGRVAFPIDGASDFAGLSRVVERYEGLIGYKPTDEQRRRLAALKA